VNGLLGNVLASLSNRDEPRIDLGEGFFEARQLARQLAIVRDAGEARGSCGEYEAAELQDGEDDAELDARLERSQPRLGGRSEGDRSI
jgi:hypothetical protein